LNPLSQDIKYLQGVGPNRAATLEKELAIKAVGDLLMYYPYKYVDRSRFYKVCEIDGNMPYVQLIGQILSFESMGEGRSKRLVAHFSDGTGVIDLVWFQGIKYAAKTYDCRKPYIVFGKPTVFNSRINIAHPELEAVRPEDIGRIEAMKLKSMGHQQNLFNEDSEEEEELTMESGMAPAAQPVQTETKSALRPAYNTTERMKKGGLTSQAMAKLTANMMKMLQQPLDETLPRYLVDRHKLMGYDEAMRNIHFPQSADHLRRAQVRLKFEELFYVQLNILRYARDRIKKYGGIKMPKVGDMFNGFYHNHLPFQLTGAQKRVVKEVRGDLCSGRQMNRLLQGDVGSGKTLVALLCSLLAIDNGCQVCIMAPTEILAEQHVETIRKFLGVMPVRVELLTGSVKGKKRESLLHDLITGSINILVGTHAVIEDNVVFSRLGLVVIDEQHRFGVAQRAKLWQKNELSSVSHDSQDGNGRLCPHVLVMTATPIPRTLAMTLYGDLDVSVIDELPPGRKPIQTIHQFDSHRKSLYASMHKQLQLGRQIYVVYPLIKESEKIDIKNLEDGYEQICAEFQGYKVSRVHGKLKPAEKDEEMKRFASGETHIMVATTVIEVGVNVPNASVMVIENAERFGLSQLHQLRGRVGRGADQSYCILVTNYKISSDTRKRLQIMVDSTDGFEIAEQDLKLRGPGDLEGTQQSGMAFDLKIANLARDGQILQYAREAAQQVVDSDPNESNPQNDILWRHLKELRKTNINWGAIS
jgi:ATP-dependent DNA helicase RecG